MMDLQLPKIVHSRRDDSLVTMGNDRILGSDVSCLYVSRTEDREKCEWKKEEHT